MRLPLLIVAATAVAVGACSASQPVMHAQTAPVPLAVQFKLTDLDYKPIAGVDVRVAFGPDPAWQAPDNGTRFVTDKAGEFKFTASIVVDPQMKKMPTNFMDSLTARAQPTDHLRVAAELPWADFRWVYVVDLWRFHSDGTILNEGISIFSRDDAGRFSREAKRKDGGWLIADLKGLALTTSPYDTWENMLDPGDDPKSPRWTLKLGFKRWPPPVSR